MVKGRRRIIRTFTSPAGTVEYALSIIKFRNRVSMHEVLRGNNLIRGAEMDIPGINYKLLRIRRKFLHNITLPPFLGYWSWGCLVLHAWWSLRDWRGSLQNPCFIKAGFRPCELLEIWEYLLEAGSAQILMKSREARQLPMEFLSILFNNV